MKKYNIKRLLSFVLVFVICTSCFSISAFAIDTRTENKMDSMLIDILNEASDDEIIPVSIWFEDIDKTELAESTIESLDTLIDSEQLPLGVKNSINQSTAIVDVSKSEAELTIVEIQSIVEAERNNAKEIYLEYNTEQFETISENLENFYLIYNCKFAPNIVIETYKSNVYLLNDYTNITNLFYYDEDILDLDTSYDDYSVSGSSSVQINPAHCFDSIDFNSSLTGNNIKIGMIEEGTPNDECISLSDVTHDITYAPGLTDSNHKDHSSNVASLMVGKCEDTGHEFTGMVPDAKLYSTSVNVTGGWKAGIEWLIDNGVNVINISHSMVKERYTSSNDVSKWIDHVAYQHSVTVVAAAGYFTSLGKYNVSPLAFANNIIVVGAVYLDCDANGNYIFSDFSNSASSEEGKYFPHVVAPANPGYIPGCNAPAGAGDVGNSYSAPMVVGAVVQLIDAQPSLATNPTLIKSLIMAGADGKKSGVSDDTTGTDMDRRYGAGVINVSRSLMCMSTSSVPKTFTYQYAPINSNITLKMYVAEPGNVRMALNWQGKSMFGDEDHLNYDDLIMYSHSYMFITVTSPNGNVYTSRDVTNTFQLLVFDAPSNDLGEYTVTISRNGPSSYSTPISLANYGADYLYRVV